MRVVVRTTIRKVAQKTTQVLMVAVENLDIVVAQAPEDKVY
jgi:hypothetical protein